MEKDLNTSSSSNKVSSVAEQFELPLSACRISGWRLPLLIRSLIQALLTSSTSGHRIQVGAVGLLLHAEKMQCTTLALPLWLAFNAFSRKTESTYQL
ncbi:hypothetical protein [Synechococcus sp. UW140]|uniref:hypothetical protein n=1 Tax=Synechococcus sp. UW140 TaxID=368503 RepID=UPI00313848BE